MLPIFRQAQDHKIPVSIKEWLTCSKRCRGVISPSIDEFYYCRARAGEDEQNFDKFDRAFGEYFKVSSRRRSRARCR